MKNVYSLLLVLASVSGAGGLPFPYLPQQVTLLNWMVIGIPALLIAMTRERSAVVNREPFLRDVGGFALRTGALFAVAGVVLLVLAQHLWGYDVRTQRTMLLTLLVLLGVSVVRRVLSGGGEQAVVADRRLRRLAPVVIPVYLVAMYWPFSAAFFRLTMLGPVQWREVLAVVIPAHAATRLSDRLVRSRSEETTPTGSLTNSTPRVESWQAPCATSASTALFP